MKLLYAAVAVLFLAGCETTGDKKIEPTVMVKNKYVITYIGDENTKLPPNVAPLDLNTATQKDVAAWIIANERRMALLEERITAMKAAPGLSAEKLKLKPDDYIIVDLSKEAK